MSTTKAGIKQYLLFIILMMLSISSSAQNKSDISIYSYLIVGVKNENGSTQNIYPLGTCFFARRGKSLFLITAKDCIKNYNVFTLEQTKAQFDTLAVRYYNTKTKKIAFYNLNIKQIKAGITNDYFYNSPDLVVMKINDRDMDPYVNSIEKYLVNTNKTGKIIDDVLSFGYGLKDISTFSSTIIAHFYQGKLADEAHTAQFYPPNNNIYYRIKPFALQGMAGSPVFLTYHMPNDSREGVIFGGVLFGTDAEHNSAYVVNGDLVKAQVANFKN